MTMMTSRRPAAPEPVFSAATRLLLLATTASLLLTIFSRYTVCEAAAMMISAEECGLNPMHAVQKVAQRTGRPLRHVLSVLKDIDRPAYDTLAAKFRQYAACVGIVDTSYFRRRRNVDDFRSMVDEDVVEWTPLDKLAAMVDSDSDAGDFQIWKTRIIGQKRRAHDEAY